jgi:hypothetical protein
MLPVAVAVNLELTSSLIGRRETDNLASPIQTCVHLPRQRFVQSRGFYFWPNYF